MDEHLWTIAELGEAVSQVLAAGNSRPADPRARAVPDLRTIRYYTSQGLLDRPLEMRGRTAYYGRRHLLQLVAIKRLQGQGASLVQIQQALAGIPDTELESIARVPEPAAAVAQSPARNQRQFWLELPAEPAPPPPERVPVPVRSELPLGGGLGLLCPLHRPLYPEDLDALQQAAAPLLRLLRRRGLLAESTHPYPMESDDE